MSDFAFTPVSFPTTSQVQQAQPTPPPQPPKSQSDHTPENTSTSSRGPAVVLSGAVAQQAGRKRDTGDQQGSSGQGSSQGSSQPAAQATGQHVNHVI
jgi:hypothetical protein